MLLRILLLFFILLTTSCVNEVDFDQNNDLSIQPKLVIPILHYKFSTTIPNGNTPISIPTVEDKVPIIFDKFSLKSDKVKNAQVIIHGNNLVDTQVEIVIEFYKEGNLTYRFQQIRIQPNKSFKFIETVSNADIDRFTSSDEVYLKILFNPFTPSNLKPSFNVQLVGEFELII